MLVKAGLDASEFKEAEVRQPVTSRAERYGEALVQGVQKSSARYIREKLKGNN